MFYTNYTWDLDGHGFQVSASSKSFQLHNLLVTRPLGVWNGVHCLKSHPGRICIRGVRILLGAKLWIAIFQKFEVGWGNLSQQLNPRAAVPCQLQRSKIRTHFLFTEFWEEMHTQVQFLCLYLVCLLTVSGQPGKKRDLIASIHIKCEKEDEFWVFQWKLGSTMRPTWFFLLPTAGLSPQQARAFNRVWNFLSTSDYQTLFDEVQFSFEKFDKFIDTGAAPSFCTVQR